MRANEHQGQPVVATSVFSRKIHLVDDSSTLVVVGQVASRYGTVQEGDSVVPGVGRVLETSERTERARGQK